MKELCEYYARFERVYVYYYDKDEAQEWGVRTFEFPDHYSITIERLDGLVTLFCVTLTKGSTPLFVASDVSDKFQWEWHLIDEDTEVRYSVHIVPIRKEENKVEENLRCYERKLRNGMFRRVYRPEESGALPRQRESPTG